MAKIAWDRDDCAFMFVLAVVRERAPCCKQFKVWKRGNILLVCTVSSNILMAREKEIHEKPKRNC